MNTQPTTSPPTNKMMVMMMMMSEQINKGHHQRSKVITKCTSIFPVFLLISVAPYPPAPRLRMAFTLIQNCWVDGGSREGVHSSGA